MTTKIAKAYLVLSRREINALATWARQHAERPQDCIILTTDVVDDGSGGNQLASSDILLAAGGVSAKLNQLAYGKRARKHCAEITTIDAVVAHSRHD